MNTGHQLVTRVFTRYGRRVFQVILLSFSLGMSLVALARTSSDRFSQTDLVAPLPQQNQKFSNDRVQLEGRLRIGSQFFNNETDQANNASFTLGTKFNYKFIESLKLKTEIELSFSSGRAQSQIEDDRLSDGFNAREAVVAFEPNSYLELGAGAVNQRRLVSTPLLMSNRSFPGAYEQVNFGGIRNWTFLLTVTPITNNPQHSIQEKRLESF